MTVPHRGTVIITGAGRGIGAAIARLAGSKTQGYSVAVNYVRDEVAALGVVHEIRDAGGTAIAVQADVGSEPDVLRLFQTAAATLGPITALVNNTGVAERLVRVEDLTAQELQRMFQVNVIGAMLCAREAVRGMSLKHGGAGGGIVNISSLAARIGGAGEWVHYAASKAAVNTFTIGLAREVATENIRVNAVAAGLVKTDFHTAVGAPDRLARLAPSIPLQRPAEPDEIAQAVLWLLSPASSYVTGTILEVGGGR